MSGMSKMINGLYAQFSTVIKILIKLINKKIIIKKVASGNIKEF